TAKKDDQSECCRILRVRKPNQCLVFLEVVPSELDLFIHVSVCRHQVVSLGSIRYSPFLRHNVFLCLLGFDVVADSCPAQCTEHCTDWSTARKPYKPPDERSTGSIRCPRLLLFLSRKGRA